MSHRVLFVGSKRMGLRCLTAMHDTAPDSLAGIVTIDDSSDTRHAFEELQQFGQARRIPVTVAASRADADKAIGAADPELVIVCGWYWMLGPEALVAARRGVVGVHNSLLPRYRGAAPIVWAILNGEPRIGLSMYSLTRGVDDGPIWAQTAVDVGQDDYIGCVLSRLEDACEEMVRRVFPRLLDGTIVPTAQDESLATFGARRRPADGAVTWTDPAAQIYRLIRAQSSPYPGAFTLFGGRRLTIWKGRPFEPQYWGRPGQIARGPAGEVLVVCGNHRAIILEEVQIEGGARGAATEVIGLAGSVLGA